MPRELVFRTTIHDCVVETFRVSGAGGQHRDKTSNGVRIKHPPSGAVGEAREQRSQLQNKKLAFRRMGESPQYQTWAKLKALALPPLHEVINDQMRAVNLVIEGADEKGRWTQLDG